MEKAKNLLCAVFLSLLTVPIMAQEMTDATHTFRFENGKKPVQQKSHVEKHYAGITQDKKLQKDQNYKWYAGLQSGMVFGMSQMSSFGNDKTHMGWTAGLHAGYRFNNILSLEAQAAWGVANLSKRECCPDYWLGADGQRYEVAVAGMEGWNYSDLQSRTDLQSYGLQLNVNLLGFFPTIRDSRWTLDIAPRLSAIGTNTSQTAVSEDNKTIKTENSWHFGAGGNLQAGYLICDHLNLGIYTGITWLSGNPLDGMPEHLHKANYIWESGLRLSWLFHNKK